MGTESVHPLVRVPGMVVAYFGYYLGYVFAGIVALDIAEMVMMGQPPTAWKLGMYAMAFVLLQKIALHDRRNDD